MSRGKSECKKSPEKELYAGKSFSKVQINWLHPTKERRYSFPIRQCLQNMDAFEKFLVSKISGRPANVRSAYVSANFAQTNHVCALSLRRKMQQNGVIFSCWMDFGASGCTLIYSDRFSDWPKRPFVRPGATRRRSRQPSQWSLSHCHERASPFKDSQVLPFWFWYISFVMHHISNWFFLKDTSKTTQKLQFWILCLFQPFSTRNVTCRHDATV